MNSFWHRIIFCLGSNLGDRAFYLQEAVKLLQKNLSLQNLKQSTIIENKALLLDNSPPDWNRDFYNIAISGDIDLNQFPPVKILKIIKKIEKQLGRKEREKWSPREIDIDIAIIDNLKIELKNLQIPHPQLSKRDFFLKNITEIEPEILKKNINKYTNKKV